MENRRRRSVNDTSSKSTGKLKNVRKSEKEKEVKSSNLTSKEEKKNQRSESLTRLEVSKSRSSPKNATSVDKNQSKKSSYSSEIVRNEKKTVQHNYAKSNLKVDPRNSLTKKQKEANQKKKSSVVTVSKSKQKSNAQIAKSFVKDVTKSQKIKVNLPKQNKDKTFKFVENDEQDENSPRPKTSTIRKGPPDYPNTQGNDVISHQKEGFPSATEESALNVETDDEDKLSYEDDFEEYDSDFEESDTDSVSDSDQSSSVSDEEVIQEVKIEKKVSRNNIKTNTLQDATPYETQSPLLIKKKGEKTFLKMSDRSSLFPHKDEIKSSIEKPLKVSHSFINFASAVAQEEKKKCTNKVLKRASELLEIITLDVVPFDIIDVPPMKYETYIRTFGKSDCKQIFTQTENHEEEEMQTDVIEMLDKWTQNPPNDSHGYGGDNVFVSNKSNGEWKYLYQSHSTKLSNFLQNCSTVILTLLDEEFPVTYLGKNTKQRNSLFYSNNYHVLPAPTFLKDISIRNLSYSSKLSNYVIAIYDSMVKIPAINDERGIICVWNVFDIQKPYRILMSNGQPTCATFGPLGSDIVIAGMADGAVVLWNLADSISHYFPVIVNNDISLLPPTYNTAVIHSLENFCSCIVAVQTISNVSEDDKIFLSDKPDSKKNFHVLTLEDMGVLNIWIIVKVLKPDISGLDSDLGLAPGGKLRLVKSTSLPLYNLNSLPLEQKCNIRTFDFQIVPFDSSRVLVTTDAGIVLHVTRHSSKTEPRFFSSKLRTYHYFQFFLLKICL